MNYQDEYNLKFHDLYLLYLQKLQYRRKQRQLEINKQMFERFQKNNQMFEQNKQMYNKDI